MTWLNAMWGYCLDPDSNKPTIKIIYKTMKEFEHWIFNNIVLVIHGHITNYPGI